MPQYTVPADELESSVQTRLRNRAAAPTVILASGDEELEVMTVGARITVAGGWLAASVPVSARLRGARVLHDTLGVVFHLGTAERGAGPGASSAVARSAEPALAQRWGPLLQRVVWEAVLAALDVAVRAYGPTAVLRGFHGGDGELVVDVEVRHAPR